MKPKTPTMAAHYSGPLSKDFWKRIGAVHRDGDYRRWQELYAMGCELQNLEAHVLLSLRSTLPDVPKGKQ